MATHVHTHRQIGIERVPGITSVRAAAAAGIVFFGLIIVNSQLRSGAPAADDSGREVLTYLTRHQDRIQLAAVVLGMAMVAALVWLSGLFRAIRKAEGGRPALAMMALGGGMLAAASTVVGALIAGATAAGIYELSAAGAHFYWSLFLMSTGATLLGLFLMIGVTSIVSLRYELFDAWFAFASVVVAAVSAAGAFTIGYASDAVQAVAALAILLDSVWILLVSVFLWRNPERGV